MIGHPYREPPAARVHAPRSLRERLADVAARAVAIVAPIALAVVACVIATRIGWWQTLLTIDIVVAIAFVFVALVVLVLVVIVAFAIALAAAIAALAEEDEP